MSSCVGKEDFLKPFDLSGRNNGNLIFKPYEKQPSQAQVQSAHRYQTL
jgi:hypothetical protein